MFGDFFGVIPGGGNILEPHGPVTSCNYLVVIIIIIITMTASSSRIVHLIAFSGFGLYHLLRPPDSGATPVYDMAPTWTRPNNEQSLIAGLIVLKPQDEETVGSEGGRVGRSSSLTSDSLLTTSGVGAAESCGDRPQKGDNPG